MFWKNKEVDQEENEVAKEENNNGVVRNIILDVMKFLEGGEVTSMLDAIKRDGVYLFTESLGEGTYTSRIMVERGAGSFLEVQLSEQERESLTSFYFKTYDAIKEREKQKESEAALDAINNIMLQAKK